MCSIWGSRSVPSGARGSGRSPGCPSRCPRPGGPGRPRDASHGWQPASTSPEPAARPWSTCRREIWSFPMAHVYHGWRAGREGGRTYNRMVVGLPTDEATDALFPALADSTRRDILGRCQQTGLSVSRLAEAYPMSFAAVQKHVAVLERAGLVSKRRRGREQLVRTEHEAVRRARLALDHFEASWRERVDQMADLLAEDPASSIADQEVGP